MYSINGGMHQMILQGVFKLVFKDIAFALPIALFNATSNNRHHRLNEIC